jgi:hypothetical protein
MIAPSARMMSLRFLMTDNSQGAKRLMVVVVARQFDHLNSPSKSQALIIRLNNSRFPSALRSRGIGIIEPRWLETRPTVDCRL